MDGAKRARTAAKARGLTLTADAAEVLGAEAARRRAAASGARWLKDALRTLKQLKGRDGSSVVGLPDVEQVLRAAAEAAPGGPHAPAHPPGGPPSGDEDRVADPRGRGGEGEDAAGPPPGALDPAAARKRLLEARNAMYPRRLAQVRQRTLKFFTPQRWSSGQGGGVAKLLRKEAASLELIRVSRLLDGPGTSGIVLGLITQPEDHRYALEDESGAIRLDLAEAETGPGFFVEGSILLAQGTVAADGVFRVRALSHPARQPRPQEPPEPLDGVGRPAPPPGPGALPGYDVVLEPEAAAAPDDRLVVLSDVRLDDAKAYDTLLAVLRRYNREAPAPGLFVLCGDFFAPRPPLQGPAAWFEEYARTLAAFGRELAGCTRLAAAAHFVLVPGPNDPTPFPGALPKAALLEPLTRGFREHVPRAHFATNPGRVWWKRRCVHVLRENLLAKLHQQSMLRPRFSPDAAAAAPTQDAPLGGREGAATFDARAFADRAVDAAAVTVLQQGHCCPLSEYEQPVLHHLDRLLHVPHLPDLLVLADQAAFGERTVLGCRCVSPGAFARSKAYAEVRLGGPEGMEVAARDENLGSSSPLLTLERKGREFHLRPANAPAKLVGA